MDKFIPYNELMLSLIETESINEVSKIGEYLTKNKYKYPLVQLDYAKEVYEQKVKDLNIKFVTV